MKSLVTGLSVRFFKVMIPTGQAGIGRVMGRTFRRGIFAPSRNIDAGNVAKTGSLANSAHVRWIGPSIAPRGGKRIPLLRNASAMRVAARISGGGRHQGSSANSESSTLRVRAHLFANPATTIVRWSKQISRSSAFAIDEGVGVSVK